MTDNISENICGRLILLKPDFLSLMDYIMVSILYFLFLDNAIAVTDRSEEINKMQAPSSTIYNYSISSEIQSKLHV